MIERIFFEEYLSFKNCSIQLKEGLIVITGVSGAGKSILTEAILALFGQKDINEGSIELSLDLDLQNEEIDNEEPIIIKASKKDKIRYFVNQKAYSKKGIKELFAPYISHIGQKDRSDLDSSSLLVLLDAFIAKYNKQHKEILIEHIRLFYEERELQKNLNELEDQEKKIAELIEYTEFEIAKIEKVNPKIGEYEELMNQKRLLSQKEKMLKALNEADAIFEYEGLVTRSLELLDEDDSFFTDAMNNLRAIFEKKGYELEGLDELNIEHILNRLEDISSLTNRYGTIEEVLAYKEKKKNELIGYKNITISKENISKALQEKKSIREKLTIDLSKNRQNGIKKLKNLIQEELKKLFLDGLNAEVINKNLDESGVDKISLILKNSPLESISSGEFNRLRLAILSVKADIFMDKRGILILDEIDANLSGEESEAIAILLKKLSKIYQVIAISHQPHLPCMADMHLLVYKNNNMSFSQALNTDESINEIARMISGSEITKEALEYARKKVLSKR